MNLLRNVAAATAGAVGIFSANFVSAAAVDMNNDGLGDLWQMRFAATALTPSADSDGDGLTNLQESIFGTNPFSASSRMSTETVSPDNKSLWLEWPSVYGKKYTLESSINLATWTTVQTLVGTDGFLLGGADQAGNAPLFLRVAVTDADSDGDGLSDWEELNSGFNPNRVFSEGLGNNPTNPTTSNPRITDFERFKTQLSANNTVSIAAIESEVSERWPHPASAIIRRNGGLGELTVSFFVGGSATITVDYTPPPSLTVTIPVGADHALLELPIINDGVPESTETMNVTLLPNAAYSIDPAASSATFNIADNTALPSEMEAARFLQQATFGPTPAEITRVRSLGFAAWLDAQFTRPVALHLPIVHEWQTILVGSHIGSNSLGVESRMEAFWRQTMRDDADSDPLRQRVAFALSQIFVISDTQQSLSNDQRGMADYQDLLLRNAFGTYRQLLEEVTRHPWMGLYLSALRNRKADPSVGRFPDENYAREVLQLFSIGLWLLNSDGTLKLSDGTDLGPEGVAIPAGEPIPTYGQTQISVFARIFTGMSYSKRFTSTTNATEKDTTAFFDNQNIPWRLMRMFDTEHDLAAKTIWLPGLSTLNLPARTASGSTAGDADLAAALDYIVSHPNTAPFICHKLIQRLVTSNPSQGYVARVSAVFANNGSGVRGDLKAVIRAILLDDEARNFAKTSDIAHGQLREPYTRFVAFSRALAAPQDTTVALGRYEGFGSLNNDFLQRPLSGPSVFNFYSPFFSEPKVARPANLTSPEFQILNSVTAISGPNRYSTALNGTSSSSATPYNNLTRLNPTSFSDDAATVGIDESLKNTRINVSAWLTIAAGNPDTLVSTLARTLCSRPLSLKTFRTITRAISRMDDPMATGITTATRDQRASHRFRVAAHLIAISPEAAILR